MTRIGIAGAGGRMGKMLINQVIDYPNLELTAAIECEDSPLVGLDPGTLDGIGQFGFLVVSDIETVTQCCCLSRGKEAGCCWHHWSKRP
jgi:4-hydroxy-tetrahydrodipicolinate reductase